MPDLLSTPGRCAAALNKTLSNKCIFSQPSSGFCESQLDPKEKKHKTPRPQTSTNTKMLKPKKEVLSSAAACRQGWQQRAQHTFHPHRDHNSCTSHCLCARCSSPRVSLLLWPFLRQLLPKSVRVKAQYLRILVGQLAGLLQDLSSDFLGSTAQQSASFPAGLMKIIYITSWFVCKRGLLMRSSACCLEMWLRAPAKLHSSYRSTPLRSRSYLPGSGFSFCKQHSSYQPHCFLELSCWETKRNAMSCCV